jgi:DNA-binding NarL/FixJ family response regulator
MENKINIVIVDDHEMFTEGLKSLLYQSPRYEVIATCADGTELLDRIDELDCHVLLLDINMPKLDGIRTLREIRVRKPKLPVIILSTYSSKEFLRSAISLSANGYVSKNTTKETLYEAIEKVLNGESYFCNQVEELAEQITEEMENAPWVVNLTDRELDILRCTARGLTSAETAKELFLSHFTVDTHKKNIMLKLNMNNSAELVRYATERGIV